MAQTIKLKRSSTGGAVPSTSSLSLGEVAINTYDGKMYIKKNDGTDAIVQIGGGSSSAVWKSYDYTATSNQTSFSGNDNNSESLSYVAGFVQVFLNGILLDPAVDYAATTGTSIVLTSGASTGDLLQIESFTQIIGTGDILVDTFPVSSTQTAFTLSQDPINKSNISVYVEGVYQESSTYSLSTTTLTLSESPANGTTVEVVIGTRNVTLDNIADLTISGTLHAGALDLGDANIINVNEISLDTIKGDADANTNITFAGSDVTTFTQGGQERLRLNTTGAQVTGNIVVSGTVDGRDVAADGVTADAALSRAGGAMGGAITTNSTFDGRDVSVDGTKLDGIESGATADQTDVEIRAAVESASDSNVFTNADHSKLDAIEASATADQTQTEINALGITATGLSGTPNISVGTISSGAITSSGTGSFTGGGNTLSIAKGSGTPALAFLGTATDPQTSALIEGIAGGGLKFYTSTGTLSSPSWSPKITLAANGNTTFAGTISSGAITSSGTVKAYGNSDTVAALEIYSNSTHGMRILHRGTDGDFSFERRVGGTNTEFLRIGRGNGNATFAGTISSGDITITGQSAGVEGGQINLLGVGSLEDIHVDNYNGTFRIFDGSAPQVRLSLDTSGNATFAGTISSGAITSTGDIEVRSGNKLILQRPNNAVASIISTDSTGAMILDSLNSEGFFFNNNGTNIFKLDPVNATFAGAITAGDNIVIGSGGTYQAGNIYSDSSWGMILRAKQANPSQADFLFSDSADNHLVRFDGSYGLRIQTGGLQIGTTTVIDASRNVSANTSVVSGNSSTSGILRSHYSDGSYMTLEGYGLVMNRGASYIRPSTDNDKYLYIGGADASLDWLQIHFRTGSGLYMTGTRFMDSGRNLENIGAITSSGDIFINGGSTTERNLRIQNTANVLYAGVEGSSGNRFVGSSAGNAFFGTTSDSGLEFATHNNVRMVVDGDGNVGIGIDAPGEKLVIKGTTSFMATNSTNRWMAYTYTDNTFRLNYNGAGADELVIESGGNVGIGTDTPSKILEVSGPGGSGGTIMRLNQENGSGASGPTMDFGYSGQAWRVGANVYATGDFVIYDTNATTKMIMIKADGKVGIGTTAPTSLLEVKGANGANGIRLTSPSGLGSALNINGSGYAEFYLYQAGGNPKVGLQANGTSYFLGGGITVGHSAEAGISGNPADLNYAEVGPGFIRVNRDDTADAAQLSFGKNGAVHSYLETRTNGLGFVTNVGDFAFEGGNVGIGLTVPSQKLDVNGAVRARAGLNLGADTFEGTSSTFTFANGVADQNVDIVLPNASLWGYLEVEVTGFYSNQNALGKLTKRYALGLNVGGTSFSSETRISDAIGPIVDNLHLGPIRWDSGTSTYRIRVAHIVSTGNPFAIKLKAFTTGGRALNLNGVNISSIYTQSTSGLTAHQPHYKTLGIGTDTPGKKLEVAGVGNTDGIRITGNSANTSLIINNTGSNGVAWDISSTGAGHGYGEGALHFGVGFGTPKMKITSTGNVGIGTNTPQTQLDVKLGNNETASIGGTISSGTYAGLRFGYSEAGNTNYRHSAIVFERDDAAFGDARGNIHILNSPSGSTSADLGDARLTILPTGNVGIGQTIIPDMTNTGITLAVTGPVLSGKAQGFAVNAGAGDAQNTRDWFVFCGPGTNSSGNYVHMKTDLDAGGTASGNIEYTMSNFTYRGYYAYGGGYGSGSIGWHNWGGTYYNVQKINDHTLQLVQASYTSSDGKVVLVALVGAGYAQFSIDWHQWAGYPFRARKVTAVSMTTSATGAY